jgi:hypothetical protein
MGKRARPEPKKPYKTPTLTAYGTVRELTQKTGRHANLDGGSPPRPNRTHI